MRTPFQITLRAARESHGYTVEEVAKYCGVSTKRMEAYELDARNMTYRIGKKLMMLYAIPLDFIHFGIEEECLRYNRQQVEMRAAERATLKKKEAV